MTQAELTLPRRSFGQTMRADVWWAQPLIVFLGLGAFVVYSTWAAFQGKNYYFGPYLSPFYSPELFGASPHSWFGPKPLWWPAWLLFSPALLVLWAPGGFRLTCYYYRGAYYKAFWADPPACTVGEPRKHISWRALLPAHHAECASLFSLSRAAFHPRARFTMSGKRSGLLIRQPGRLPSGWASARWSWRSMSCSLAATLLVVIPCAISSADFSINSRNRPLAIVPTPASVVSIVATCSGPG